MIFFVSSGIIRGRGFALITYTPEIECIRAAYRVPIGV